jgi:hypothetical protein
MEGENENPSLEMLAERTTIGDGRYLIFYTFTDKASESSGDEDTREAQQRGE